MKKFAFLIALIICVMSFSACADKVNISKVEQDGLAISVQTEKEIYKADEDINIVAKLENNSGKTIYNMLSQIPVDKYYIRVQIFNSAGKLIGQNSTEGSDLVMRLTELKDKDFIEMTVNLKKDILDEDENLISGEYKIVCDSAYTFEERDYETAIEHQSEKSVIETEVTFRVE